MVINFRIPKFSKAVLTLVLLVSTFSASASYPFVFGGVNDDDPTLGLNIDSNSDNPETMAVGGNGYLYIGGDFLGADINFSANFTNNNSLVSSTIETQVNEYTDDAFIAAYKANTELQWVVSLQSADNSRVYAVTADDSGNVYATGYFNSTVQGSMQLNRISSNGVVTQLGSFSTTANHEMAFILKLSPSGSLTWFKILDGSGADSESAGRAIAIDDAENVYVGGEFRDEIDFDPNANSTLISSNDGEDDDNSDAFVIKLSNSGSLLWVKTLGGENSGDQINDMAIDSANNALYIGGTLSSDSDGVNLDGDINTLEFDSESPAGATDNSGTESDYDFGFVQKIQTTDGNLVWSRVFLADDCVEDSNSSVSTITLNLADNSVFVAGNFDNLIDFDPSFTANRTNGSSGDEDLFFVKLDASGNYLWHGVLGNQAGNTDEGIDAIHFGNDKLYISGDYSGVSIVGSGTAAGISTWANNIPASNGDQDALLLQLNASDGSFVWARNFGGTDYDTGDSFAQDSDNNVYFAGQFKNTIDLDPSVSVLNATTKDGIGSGGRDAFVVKLSESGGLITAVSNPPVAIANAIFNYVQQNQWGKVEGADSYDLNGESLNFTWRQVEGPQLTILTDDEELTFVAPFVDELVRITVELVVSNATFKSQPIEVSFFVGPDSKAEFDLADIAEKSDGGALGYAVMFLLLLVAMRRGVKASTRK